MKRLEEHIFLVLALVAFIVSAGCYVFLERNAPNATDEQYLSTVQQHVKAEMRVSTDELADVTAHLQLISRQGTRRYDFGKLAISTRYPYYIFRNQQLIYWSDHRFVPDYEHVASVTDAKLVDFDQGRYIVSRNRIVASGDTLDVFSLLPIFRHYNNTNNYLQSGYNPTLFALDPQAIRTTKGNTYQNIYDNTPRFLFSVEPPRIDVYRNRSTPANTVILAALGMLFLGFYVFRRIYWLNTHRQYERGFLWLALYLLLLRGAMLYFGVPFLFVETDLFNPKFYASSVLAPSLGDLLINTLVLAILAFYIVNHYYRSHTYAYLIRQMASVHLAVAVASVTISYWVFTVCFTELNSIYEKSQFTLDITLSIRFTGLKVACLLVFVGISFVYFLVMHLLASLFLRLTPSLVIGVGAFVAGTILAIVVLLAVGWSLDPILALNGLYLLVLFATKFPNTLYTLRYKTSIYLFSGAFICALTTAYVVYNQELRKDWVQKKEFGAKLLAENDEFGEFLLNKARESLVTDSEIRRAFETDELFGRERVQQRIKSIHLDKYFDKYDIEVLSFDPTRSGDEVPASDFDQPAHSYTALQTRYQQARYHTQFPGLYFVNEVGNNFIKQYVSFMNVYRPDMSPSDPAALLGHIVLDLKLRNETPKSVYPELLVDKKFIQAPEAREYSYAIFGQPAAQPGHNSSVRLLYSAGSYNYERRMPVPLLSELVSGEQALSRNGYRHVAQRGKNGRIIVVSSPDYPITAVFSNFSFLYLLLVLTVICVIVAYAIQYGLSRFSVNYSTRIQILLNVAFFLPLSLVVVIILSVISANYVSNQENAYISSTRNIAANLLTYLDEYLVGKRSQAALEEELKKIARDAAIDVNLYDTQGKLFTSTQPLMYENGHLSKYINPTAYLHLIEDKENQVLLNESLGNLNYRAAYASIKSYDGRLLGVLSVPYFYAGPELDRQIIEVISSALSVFTALFILFLVLSYFASNLLTSPLKMITQKIKKTNLDKLNEPLPWKSDDEIGILIDEYNRMLVKLDESKRALSQSEKQTAWREMAKQVAHEIKNPLTPMKLTLQHLQRTMPGRTSDELDTPSAKDLAGRRIFQRTVDSLLDQIDNISAIATSFSDFADMPLPKNELFELTSVLNKAADLYADDTRITLKRQISPKPIMIRGDRQMMGRILTNLIINGIQSVPAGRKPVIDLRLYADDQVHVEVHDNGAGIPETIRAKVFLPNFSTKQGGSGLGLAIAKRGVEHAGGDIWFETMEDVGTSFFITMPLATAPANGQRNGAVSSV